MAYDPLKYASDDISPRAFQLLQELQEKLKDPAAKLEELSKAEDEQIEAITRISRDIGKQLREVIQDSEDFEDQEDAINETFGELLSEAIATTSYVSSDEWESSNIDEVNLWVPSTC